MMIRIYCFAAVNNFAGTFKTPKIGLINTVPIRIKTMEMTAPRISAIANDFLTLFVSPAPNFCAVMIANPFASPNKNPTIKLLIVVVAPTAANDCSPRKLPTILVSARLYVSCNKFPKNTGIANPKINVEILPFVRSFIIDPPLSVICHPDRPQLCFLHQYLCRIVIYLP